MKEVSTLPRPYKGLRSRRQGSSSRAHPGKRRGHSASLLSHWGPQSPSAKGVGRREPGWRLWPLLPPARSLASSAPSAAAATRDRADVAFPELWRSPALTLQRGTPLARPPRPSPGPPLRPQGARSHCRCALPARLPARPGRRPWGGRARLCAAGSSARPAHCPQARDAAAAAETQSPRLGPPGG